MSYATKEAGGRPDAIAPDGSEVRILCVGARGSMATFSLPPKAIAKAVAHRTVEEVWYVVAGQGRMWRRLGERDEVVEIGPGVSLSIPVGTHFQFRCDGDEALHAVAVTVPPWPGDEEAYGVEGPWEATT
jgi:mannose-6-phosphate isomerase-like protein (cupin superfamily)